jgi:hypothetical protein
MRIAVDPRLQGARGEHVPADDKACAAAEIPTDCSWIRVRRRAERMRRGARVPVGRNQRGLPA